MTPEAIKQTILSAIRSGQGLSAMAGGFADGVAGPVAVEMSKLYMALDAVPSMVLLDESSGPFIELVGEQYWGITRRPGTRAYCTINFSGTPGYTVPAGTQFLTAQGLSFSLVADEELDNHGIGSGQLEADQVGSAYNVAAGAIVRMYVNLPGLNTYTSRAAQGGTDPETDQALLERIRERVRQPPTSGNGYYYRQLAMSVSGVGNAKITELAGGPGTVGVMLVTPEGRAAPSGTIEAVEEAIAPQRVVGAAVTVSAPTEVTINVTCRVGLATGTEVETVEAALTASVAEYLQELIRDKYDPIYYSAAEDGQYKVSGPRVLGMLLSIPGVETYSQFLVNGVATGPVMLSGQIPVMGTVTLTATS